MISFEHFTIEDGSPIYSQIVRHIKQGIIAGVIHNREEMPSRRLLSALLGVNPNTIQKAYRLLEEEGIIESQAGAGSWVTVNEQQIGAIRSQLLEGDVGVLVKSMKQMEISKEEAVRLLEDIWDEI
ncbi:MAG: GntR family transcriptional regulator [Clostridiales bacterium]